MRAKMKTVRKLRLGEMLVQYGRINYNQLKEAMKVQSQSGGFVGEILVELGYITVDELLEILGKQFDVPTANLYKLDIEPSVINILSFDIMKDYKVLPIAIGDRSVTLAMVNPYDITSIGDLEFILERSIQPVVVLYFQMVAALKHIEEKGGRLEKPLSGKELEGKIGYKHVGVDIVDLKNLFRRITDENASDLLLTAGIPPCLKKGQRGKKAICDFVNATAG